MTTVGVFGGSFNPPHLGHQMIALAALETGAVDQIVVVPTHRHAFGKALAPYDDRVAMCELAFELFGERARVSRVEQQLGGESSRTYHTLVELSDRLPGAALRLIIGADILEETASWYRWDDVVALAPPLTFGRVGRAQVADAVGVDIVIPNISSTEVRARLGRGQTALPLVSSAVMDYIDGRALYRGESTESS